MYDSLVYTTDDSDEETEEKTANESKQEKEEPEPEPFPEHLLVIMNPGFNHIIIITMQCTRIDAIINKRT